MQNDVIGFLGRAALACLAFAAIAGAQPYTISTFAGGGSISYAANSPVASYGVACDSLGNVYFTASNSVLKVNSTGTIAVVAGNGHSGFAGDGGAASAAQLNSPLGITIDVSGNLYVADSGNNRVRKITTTGNITTVAGSGATGTSGDGGLATLALLEKPTSVAVDSAGDLFIGSASKVREVFPNGTITTLSFSALGVATDTNGNVFLSAGPTIDKMDTQGNITKFATITNSYSCVGNPLPTTPDLGAMVVDSSGNLYVADLIQGVVYQVNSNATVTRIAGNGTCTTPGGDGGPAASATLGQTTGLSLDNSGNLYVAAGTIRKVSPSRIITSVTGGPLSLSVPGVTFPQVLPSSNFKLATDSSGNVFICDTGYNVVWELSVSSGSSRIIAGTLATSGFSGDGGPATTATLWSPHGVAIDTSGNVYIADTQNNRIRRIASNGTISTIAGTGIAGLAGDGGPASAAVLSYPFALGMDLIGNLYVADQSGKRIRKINPAGVISTVGAPPQLQASAIVALAADSKGNIFYADQGNNDVGRIAADGTITNIAGDGLVAVRAGNGDGALATSAELNFPSGITIDAQGDVFIADTGDNVVRMIAPTGIISTVGGNGRPTSLFGDGGLAVNGELDQPLDVAIDSSGNLYVADSGNLAVRKLQPAPTGVPQPAALTNAFSNVRSPVSPGEIIVIYGVGLGPSSIAQAQPQNGGFPTQVGGVQVLFNGVPAPMIYAWTSQVAAVAPYGAPIDGAARVQVQYQGQTVVDQTEAVAESAPGIATADASGSGQAAALNQDGTRNSASNPAKPGSVISLFWTGGGQLFPPVSDGQLNSATVLSMTGIPVSATVGGLSAPIQYVGTAPTLIAGALQINLQLPPGGKTGNAVPVVITVGASCCGSQALSQGAVTVAIASN